MRSKCKTEWFGADESFSSPSLHRLPQNGCAVQTPGKHKLPRKRECWFLEDCVLICVWPSQLLIDMALQNSIIPPTSFSFQNPILQAEQLPERAAPCSGNTASLSLDFSARLVHFFAFYVDTSFWKMRTCHHPSGILFFIVKKHSPKASFYLVDRVRRSTLTPNLRNLL